MSHFFFVLVYYLILFIAKSNAETQNSHSKCALEHENQFYDLTSLPTTRFTLGNTSFVLSPCDTNLNCSSQLTSLCANKTVNLGSISKSNFTNRSLQLIYTNGDECDTNRFITTKVTLICVDNNSSQPSETRVSDHGCLYEIYWRTSEACANRSKQIRRSTSSQVDVINYDESSMYYCTLNRTVRGKNEIHFYNLSAITRQTFEFEKYSALTNVTLKYKFRVCHNIHIEQCTSRNVTSNVTKFHNGLFYGGAVCLLGDDNKCLFGKANDHFKVILDETHSSRIRLIYQASEPVLEVFKCRPNKHQNDLVIDFLCDQTRQDISMMTKFNDTTYYVELRTRHACPKIISLKNEALDVEKRLKTFDSVTPSPNSSINLDLNSTSSPNPMPIRITMLKPNPTTSQIQDPNPNLDQNLPVNPFHMMKEVQVVDGKILSTSNNSQHVTIDMSDVLSNQTSRASFVDTSQAYAFEFGAKFACLKTSSILCSTKTGQDLGTYVHSYTFDFDLQLFDVALWTNRTEMSIVRFYCNANVTHFTQNRTFSLERVLDNGAYLFMWPTSRLCVRDHWLNGRQEIEVIKKMILDFAQNTTSSPIVYYYSRIPAFVYLLVLLILIVMFVVCLNNLQRIANLSIWSKVYGVYLTLKNDVNWFGRSTRRKRRNQQQQQNQTTHSIRAVKYKKKTERDESQMYQEEDDEEDEEEITALIDLDDKNEPTTIKLKELSQHKLNKNKEPSQTLSRKVGGKGVVGLERQNSNLLISFSNGNTFNDTTDDDLILNV